MSKTKIKTGDIVVGNKKARKYGITGQGWEGEVIDILNFGNTLLVTDMSPEDRLLLEEPDGEFFEVDVDAFDLAYPSTIKSIW